MLCMLFCCYSVLGTKERKIPYPTSHPMTQLFRFVSCPNYTYEVSSTCTRTRYLFISLLMSYEANVWLHSSVGRASHRYRGGWSPDFFQASSFQLLKLENLLRWSFFTFMYNCISQASVIDSEVRKWMFSRLSKCSLCKIQSFLKNL